MSKSYVMIFLAKAAPLLSALHFNTWHRHPSIRVHLLQHFVQLILPQIHPPLSILTAVILVQATFTSHLDYRQPPKFLICLPSLQLLLHTDLEQFVQ